MRRLGISLVGFASLAMVMCSSPPVVPPPPAPKPTPEPAPNPEPVVEAPPAPDAAPPVDPDRDPGAPDDVTAIPDDATLTSSGLAYRILDAGDGGGQKPGPDDRVKVHYTGWTTNGHRFDTSLERGPATFPLNAVIPGWTEGMQLLGVGQKARLWIPEALAYNGRPGTPQGMLVFDVELVEVFAAPVVPESVAAPPRKAKRTRKGVRYIVLKKGTSRDRPKTHDRVEVHYTGWTTDGKMFDSSVTRGQPAKFVLTGVIAGWTDVVSRMRVGATWRVWIPEKLAYKGKPGRPAGMLVFDIELLSIERLPAPPKAPRNVKRPPRSAKKTASGLRYRVLTRGKKGAARPELEGSAKVHYSGWTTDGKLFDSSVSRGKPATFPLSAVVPGFREALLLMRVGEKIRVWIPEELAYEGKPGRPAGMLVFDLELLEAIAGGPDEPTD